jgi:hypothetical protein
MKNYTLQLLIFTYNYKMNLIFATKQSSFKVISTVAILVAINYNSSALADYVRRSAAPAQNPRVQFDSENATQKSFSFSASNASLKQNGDISIDGVVTHKGLLCADYEVGLRFGKGSGTRGCTDIEWLTSDEYVWSKSLCNNATIPYQTVGHVDLLEAFDQITCAERILRCSGNCK